MLLDLPSSASAVDFTDNIINNLKVRLPQKLVAHIPNKFYDIVAGEW